MMPLIASDGVDTPRLVSEYRMRVLNEVVNLKIASLKFSSFCMDLYHFSGEGTVVGGIHNQHVHQTFFPARIWDGLLIDRLDKMGHLSIIHALRAMFRSRVGGAGLFLFTVRLLNKGWEQLPETSGAVQLGAGLGSISVWLPP